MFWLKKTMNVTVYILAFCSLMLLSFAICAQDFTVDDSSNSSDEESFNIDVTAQKRTEKVQDVPASVTAIDAGEIKDGDVDDTQDVERYVPNMQIYDMGEIFSFYSIRGQTNSNTTSNPIGTYVDDVPSISNAYLTDMPLWGVEQIEVLRGPQGNLYGINSSGGVVNIKTRQPDNYWTAGADLSYGSYNAFEGKGNVSGPLIKDTLYFGLSGIYRRSDSYVEEEGNDDRNQWLGGGRGQIRYTPFDRLDLTLTAQSSYRDINYGYSTTEDDDPYKIDNKKYGEYSKTTAHTQSLRAQYSLDSFDILSVTGLANGKLESQNDYSSEAYDYYVPAELKSNTLSEELRFVSNTKKSPFKWLAGFFYRGETQEYTDTATMIMSGYESESETNTEINQKNYAAFSEVSYTLFNRLTLTPGIRYDHDQKDFEQESAYGNLDDSKEWNFVSPRFAVDYKLTDDALVYSSLAKGAKAGGFALTSSSDVDNLQYDQEDIISVEAGSKTTWLGGKLMANIAGFYNDVDNMQIMVYNYDSSGSGVFNYTNTSHATIYGIELELATRPIRGLELGVPVGWMSSNIDEHETKEYEGNRVPYVPEYTVGAFAQYTHRTGVFARGEITQLGKTYYDEANECSQDAYNVVNVKAGYKHEHFSLAAYCKNLLDKEYYTYKAGASNNNLAVVGAPRTFGVQASTEF